MIAEFDGWEQDPATKRWKSPSPKIRGTLQYLPDYPHDLNATMRAARKLPKPYQLTVFSDGTAGVYKEGIYAEDDFVERKSEGDPARAAFEVLAAYLMERK